jgi:hypothetical protein
VAFVYIIICKRRFKVGYSSDPEKRLQAIIRDDPKKLAEAKLYRVIEVEGPAARHVERWIHRRLEKHGVGGEWFRCDLQLANHWMNVCRGYEEYVMQCIKHGWRIDPDPPADWHLRPEYTTRRLPRSVRAAERQKLRASVKLRVP